MQADNFVYMKSSIQLFSVSTETAMSLPFVKEGISAGFPSPALDFIDLTIDLNKHLIKHPSATFYGRVKGHSLKDAGIHDNDLLIIDRSITPAHGKIAVCFLNGEFTAKRIKKINNEIWLVPENENYAPIKINEDSEFVVWGVVTYVIKSV